MRGKPISICLATLFLLSVNSLAEGAKASKIISRSNTKTGNDKTVFKVKPGEQITFSVKADGAEQYQWRVNGQLQEGAASESFKWTVPEKKGMWKILIRSTNNDRRKWVAQRAKLWEKWITVRQRHGKKYPKEKEKFIRDMIDLNIYPTEGQTEWIVSTFLTTVQPGESIQKAIDSVPTEGGIVKLADGTHEITNTLYPPQAFPWYIKGRRPTSYTGHMRKYSIIIKKSNVTIYGSRKAIVRHHDKDVNCFLLPDLEGLDPARYTNVYVENTTFRGFTTASAYGRKDRPNSVLIAASHVKNLTVEDIHDTSYAIRLVANLAIQSRRRFSSGLTYRNNVIDHGGLMVMAARDVHIFNNRIIGWRGTPLYTDQAETHVHVIGNYVRGGSNKCFTPDGGIYWEVRNNNFTGSQCTMWIQQGASRVIVANNTLTGTSRYAILLYPQGALDNVIIVNNRIFNNKGHGIYSQEYQSAKGLGTVRIINNIIYNNGKDGIRTNTQRQTLIVSNNIIANNKGCGLNPANGKIVNTYNNLWNNASGDYSGTSAGTGDFSKDPLFADAAKGDFHLKSKTGRWDPKTRKWLKDKVQSPCIDTGDPKTDCSQEPDPNGGRVNMGAYGNTIEASKS